MKFILILLFALITIAAGCSPTSIDPPTVPSDAYGLASDPLPDGATLVTEEEFNKLKANPNFKLASANEDASQAKSVADQLASDETVIRDAEQKFGHALIPTPPTPDQDTVLRGDDTVAVNVNIRGNKQKFTTMGTNWSKHAVATALRLYPTRANQIDLYTNLYNSVAVDSNILLQFGVFISPDLLKQYPTRYSDEYIKTLNQNLSQYAQSVIGTAKIPNLIDLINKCDGDAGNGTGGDQFANTDACGTFQKTGIFKNYSFPARPYLTCVKNQAARGTCASFATTSAIEYHVLKKHNASVNLSEQALYNQAKFNWKRGDFGDGFWPNDLLNSMESNSWIEPFEYQWNYNPSNSRNDIMSADGKSIINYTHSCDGYSETCSDTTHQSQFLCINVAAFRYCGFLNPEKNAANRGYRVTTHAQIWDPTNKAQSTALIVLATVFRQPVLWSFPVTPNFEANSNGFVTYKSGETNRGGHVAHIVGFISNATLANILPSAPKASGDGYFIVKNSWSNCFGDAGYAYIPYDFVKEYTLEATVLHGVE